MRVLVIATMALTFKKKLKMETKIPSKMTSLKTKLKIYRPARTSLLKIYLNS